MRGVTLVELIVALALLGVILGVSGVALASLREPSTAEATRQLAAARADAIRKGRPVFVTVPSPDTGQNHAPRTTHLLFLPDGRALGPDLDPLTGAPRASR